jgi:predicted phosphodiesterase
MNTPHLTRREFLQRTLAGGAAAAAGALAGCVSGGSAASASSPPPTDGVIRPTECIPMLYWTGEREASLSWPVKALSRGWVEYGSSPVMGRKAMAGDDVADYAEGFSEAALQAAGMSGVSAPPNLDAKVLRARLKDLAPGQPVYYRVHTQPEDGQSIYGEVRQFTLPDGRATDARLAFWNDTHDNQETLKSLQALTSKEPADLLVWNGDASNNIEREDQIVPIYLAPGKGLDITRTLPMVFARGNHDERGRLAARLGHYSAMRRSYFSFRIGPVAALVLDTGEDKPDNHPTFEGRPAFEPLLKKQSEWLAAEIGRPGIADAPYRLVICHIPLRWRDEKPQDYAQSGYDRFCVRGRALWHESLVRWKAQVVISGHTHESRFLAANEAFSYAQITGGGPQPNVARLMRLNANRQTLAVQTLDLTGKVLREERFSPIR